MGTGEVAPNKQALGAPRLEAGAVPSLTELR